jgi:hypothetical protein
MLILLFPVSGLAQKRRRSTGRAPRPAANTSLADTQAGAARVAEQIKNLTRFLYLFGRISNGIETTEQMAAQERGRRTGTGSPQLEKTKSGLLDSIRNVRAGLEDLESYFESTPAVRKYYGNVAGVASAAASAESQASAGQYDQAGRALLGAVNKLSDALLLMR